MIKVDGDTVYLPNGQPAPKKKKKAKAKPATNPTVYLPNGRPAPPPPPPPPPPASPAATPGAITDVKPLYELGNQLNMNELRWLTKLAWTTKDDDTDPELAKGIDAARAFLDKIKKSDPNFSVGLDYQAWHKQGKTQNTNQWQAALDAQDNIEAQAASAKQRARAHGTTLPKKENLPDFLYDVGPDSMLDAESVARAARNVYGGKKRGNLDGLLIAKNIKATRTIDNPKGEGKVIEILLEKNGKQYTILLPPEALPDKMAQEAEFFNRAPLDTSGQAAQGAIGGLFDAVAGAKTNRADFQLGLNQRVWNEVFGDTKVPNLPLELAAVLSSTDAPELETEAQIKNMFLALKDPYVLDPRNPYRIDPETFFKFEGDLQESLNLTSDRAIGIANRDTEQLAGVLTPNEGDTVHEGLVDRGVLSDEDKIRLDGILATVPLSVGVAALSQDINDFVSVSAKKNADMRTLLGQKGGMAAPPHNAITMIQEWLTDVDPSIKVGGKWTPQMDEAIKLKCYASALWRAAADPKDDEARIFLQQTYGIDDVNDFINNQLSAPEKKSDEELKLMDMEQRQAYFNETIMTPEQRKAQFLTRLAADSRLPFEAEESAIYKLWVTDPAQVYPPEITAVFEHAREMVGNDLKVMFEGGVDPLAQKQVKGGGRYGAPSIQSPQTVVSKDTLNKMIYSSLTMAALDLYPDEVPVSRVGRGGMLSAEEVKEQQESQEAGSNFMASAGKAAGMAFNALAQVTTTAMEDTELQRGQELAAGDTNVGRTGKGKAGRVVQKELNEEAVREWTLYQTQQHILHPDMKPEELTNRWMRLGYSWDEMRRRSGGGFMSMGVYVMQDADPEYKPGDNMLAEFLVDCAFEFVAYAPISAGYKVAKTGMQGAKWYGATRGVLQTKLGLSSVGDVWGRCSDPSFFHNTVGILDPDLCVELAEAKGRDAVKEVWDSATSKLIADQLGDEATGGALDLAKASSRAGHMDMAKVDINSWGFTTKLRMNFSSEHPLLAQVFHVMNKTTQSGEHALDWNAVQSVEDAARAVIRDPKVYKQVSNAMVRVLAGREDGAKLIDELEALLVPKRAAARRTEDGTLLAVALGRERVEKLTGRIRELEDVYQNAMHPKARTRAKTNLDRAREELTAVQRRLDSSEARGGVDRGRKALPDARGQHRPLSEGEKLMGQRILTDGELEDIRHNLKATIDDMYDVLDEYRWSKPANDPRIEGMFRDRLGEAYDEEIARTAREFPEINDGKGFISDGALYDFWSENVVRQAESKYRIGARAKRTEGIGQKYGTEPWRGGHAEASTAVTPGDVYTGLLSSGVAARAEVRAVKDELEKLGVRRDKAEAIIAKMNDSVANVTRRTRAALKRQVLAFQRAGLDAEQALLEADRSFVRELGEATGVNPGDLQGEALDAFKSLAHESGIPVEDITRWAKDWAKITDNLDVRAAVPTSDPEGIAGAVARRAVRRQSAVATKARAESILRIAAANPQDYRLMREMVYAASSGDAAGLISLVAKRQAFDSLADALDNRAAPGVSFHGSREAFDTIDPERGISTVGRFDVTDNPEAGKFYSESGKKGEPHLLEIEGAPRNPMDLDAPPDFDSWGRIARAMGVPEDKITRIQSAPTAKEARSRILMAVSTADNADDMAKKFSDVCDAEGFDAFVFAEDLGPRGGPQHTITSWNRSAITNGTVKIRQGVSEPVDEMTQAYRTLVDRGLLTTRECEALGVDLGDDFIAGATRTLAQGRGEEFGGLFRALSGDPDELGSHLEAFRTIDNLREAEASTADLARNIIADVESDLAKFEALVAAKDLEGQLALLKEIAEKKNVGDLEEAFAKTNAPGTEFIKDPETGLTREMRPDEKLAALRGGLTTPQPMLPTQRAAYAHPPWDTHEMTTWSLGSTGRRIEEFNTKKRFFGKGPSVDQMSGAFKVIILARIATAFRIVLGDEGTRFFPEGINPVSAQHRFKELLEYEVKTGRHIIPPELRVSLSQIYGTVRKSNFTVMGPEDPDFLVSWTGALRQWNTDPLVREWRATYVQALREGMSEEQAGARCKQMLLDMANERDDNVVNQHLRLTNNFWPANVPLRASYGDGTAADVLEQMKIAFQTQNLDEWSELVNHNLLFYARNKYTKKHFLPQPDGSYLTPKPGDFRYKVGRSSVSRMDDVKRAPRTSDNLPEGLDETDVMPTIIARVQGADPGNFWTPQNWFGSVLEGLSGHMVEGTYAHFYLQARTAMLTELGQRAGLNVGRGVGKGFDPEDAFSAYKFLPEDAVKEVERRAMAFGQQQVRRVMYTTGTSAAEDLMRNFVLFLPAQRQYLAYWMHAIVQNPVLLAYFNRLNKLPDYLELPRISAPGDASGEDTTYKVYLRGLMFATPGFQGDSMGQKAYQMVPGLGLPGLLVGFGVNVSEAAGFKAPKEIAMKLPGGTFYKDMYRPLNSSLTAFTYALSTMALGRPFNLMPEQIVGDDSTQLYKYSELLKATLSRAMKDQKFGDLPEAKSHARWTEGLRALMTAGWNFMVPSKLTIQDNDVAAVMDAQRKWDQAATYGEREQLLQAEKDTLWGKTMRVTLQEDKEKAKDALFKNPECIPYFVTQFGVVRPTGEDYDFENLVEQAKSISTSTLQLQVTQAIDREMVAEQKWFDKVYMPAVKKMESWVGPGIVGLPKDEAGDFTPSSPYNLARIESDFLNSTGVFEQGLPGKDGKKHYGMGQLKKKLDDLGGKVYLPQSDFPATADSMLYKATEALYELRSGARFVRTSRNYDDFSDIYRLTRKEGEKEVIITAATMPFTKMDETQAAAVYGKRFGHDERWALQHIAAQVTWYDKIKAAWVKKHPGDEWNYSDVGKSVKAQLTNEIWKLCAGPNALPNLRGGLARQMLYTPLVRPHYIIYDDPDYGKIPQSQMDPTAPMNEFEAQADALSGINDIRPLDPANPNKPRIPSQLPVNDPSGQRKIKFNERAVPERAIAGIIANAAFHFRFDKSKGTFVFSKKDLAVSKAEDAYLKAYMRSADPMTKYNIRETQRAYCWYILLTEMVEEHNMLWGYQSEYQKDNGGYKGRSYTEGTTVKVVKKINKQWLKPLFEISPLFEAEFNVYNREASGNLITDMLMTFR